ncbi:MAG TPA: acetylornithine/succinylornithine family transaminase [Tepidisphaeraceae bacterium]|jgi:predicted acetylornithine/succinylornithine family transaminase|nr:acetylornithine/succinylornithine family transaminase [Tepidisphaeraceae bacterium]
MSCSKEILDRAAKVLIGNYARQPVVMARGKGSDLWDADGKQYLDLFAGFGGAILGHCHPALIEAATAQMGKLWHVGNTYHTEPQVEFAERLNRHAFEGQAFFCHSGLEANEAGCKLARLRGQEFSPNRWKIISLSKSFHGRSLAMISATGNPAVRQGFGPEVPGFIHVDSGSIDAVTKAIDPEVAGIIMEPIQGEGGVNLYPPDYAANVRRLCDERDLTLIFDEVWTGCGRTGRWFGFQHFQSAQAGAVEPDILTLGKAIGGGLPVGTMFAKPRIANFLVPGKHGCTLGGNPICMAVARTIFDVIERDRLLSHAAALGEHAMARLRNEPSIKDKIQDVRGRGLMLGIELKNPPQNLVERGLENGIIINLTAQKVIRLAPALTISSEQWDRGLDLLVKVIQAV